LTEELSVCVLDGRLEEVGGILASRQALLDQLETMDIDAAAAALLAKTAESERHLLALLQRTQGEATAQLAALFKDNQKVRGYAPTAKQGRLLQTG
jgi:hypothetical protein